MTAAIVATAFGGPEVLAPTEVEVAGPGIGEVTIEVRAAGVNPSDGKRVAGMFGTDPSKLPLRLGSEVAGVVTAVGPDAVFELGDEVVAYTVAGGWAGAVTARGANVFAKPVGLGWDEAAGLLLVGTTAAHLLEATGVGEGDTVLVHGASGGVGVIAAQLARLRGTRVIGTASARGAKVLDALGIEAVRYGDGLLERVRATGSRIDAALDTVGTDEAVDVSLAVADVDRIATIAAFHRESDGIKVLGSGANRGTDVRNAARPQLLELAGRGDLVLPMGPSFPLADAADALRLVMTGHPGGKVVLHP